METVIVIGIVSLAGVYVARIFYLKFRQGKSNEGSGAFLGCSCSNNCTAGGMDGNCTNVDKTGGDVHAVNLEEKNA